MAALKAKKDKKKAAACVLRVFAGVLNTAAGRAAKPEAKKAAPKAAPPMSFDDELKAKVAAMCHQNPAWSYNANIVENCCLVSAVVFGAASAVCVCAHS